MRGLCMTLDCRCATSARMELGPLELMSLGETDAARAATWSGGHRFGRILRSSSPPEMGQPLMGPAELTGWRNARKQSEEGDVLQAIERILSKVARHDGTPKKFPPPSTGIYNLLVVDVREFLNGGDEWDYRMLAHGSGSVPTDYGRTWIADDGTVHPIRGLFDPKLSSHRAKVFRERVHFVSFISEKTYAPHEIADKCRYFENPALFGRVSPAGHVISTFPSSVGNLQGCL